MLEELARYRGCVKGLYALGPTVQEGVATRDAFEQRADESLVLSQHALEGAPRGSGAFIRWPVGYALSRRGSKVELNAVGGGVR